MDSRKIPINSSKPFNDATDSDDSSESSAEFRVVDKRPFANLEAGAPPAGHIDDKPRYPSFVEELRERAALAERRFAEKAKQIDQEIARAKARLEAEHDRQLALAKNELLLPFLDVLDNLERALQVASSDGSKEDLYEGLRLTVDLFRTKLRMQAIEPVVVLGQVFDPNVSQAVGVVPVASSERDGVVVEEVIRGYRMGDNLVRPAQVRVGQYQAMQSLSS